MEPFMNYLPLIICGLLASGLLAFEVVMPGFGAAGISGGILLVLDMLLLWSRYGATAALGGTIAMIALTAILSVIYIKSGLKGRFQSMVLSGAATKAEGYQATEDLTSLQGAHGITVTPLRPSGIALINKRRYAVQTEGDFADANEPIIVTRAEGGKLFVANHKEGM